VLSIIDSGTEVGCSLRDSGKMLRVDEASTSRELLSNMMIERDD
jgi:hypothetical protein